ncbi:hypothetical protein OG930_41460 [Streptomyces sp. NBC_01799]|nr:hypothetical protein OG930_41460 [Streptomyces sp. NBC_01799]
MGDVAACEPTGHATGGIEPATGQIDELGSLPLVVGATQTHAGRQLLER